MNLKYFAILTFVFVCFFVPSVYAANPGDVVINEIAWMGSPPEGSETTNQAANDEWVELYNASANEINVSGWVLKSRDGNPTIELSGAMPSGAYFLLSRANDTVMGMAADIIYPYKDSALGNGGEHLELMDNSGNIIDTAGLWNMDWFAGNNTTKLTMERKDPKLHGSDLGSWANSANPGGTPKAQNSVYSSQEGQISDPVPAPEPTEAQQIVSESPNPTPTPTPEIQPSKSEKAASTQTQAPYPSNIFINELMPYPLGPDELEEWIEVTNENSEPADISLWQIKDTLGATNIYILPKGTIIAAKSFLVLSRLTTNMTMNNDGDAVQLIRPDGELVQTAPYEKTEKGKSYVRSNGLWKWSSVPTPGSANIVPAPVQNTSSVEDVKKIVKEYSADTSSQTPNLIPETPLRAPHQLASIVESAPKTSTRLVAFLASSIALLSAIFIFLLKKRLARPT
ncbi:MAG: lamin tail domain-containing protein [Candidatus Spechtbacterales bacterium]